MSASTPMPRAVLGRTGIETSKLSLGAWGFGTASAPQAQAGDDENLAAILTAAFAAGIRLIDSAEAYANEDRIGRILSQIEVPDDLTIVTKFGHGKGFSADQFRRSAEQSLTDLHLESIPMMMIHDPRGDEDMDFILGPGGALEGLRKLQDEGLVQHIGVATGTLPPLHRAVECGEFDAIQFPRLYTLVNQAARTSGLLDAAAEKNMATMLAAPFTGNILATGAVEGALYSYWPAPPELIEGVQKMEARCAELGVTLPVAALAYALTEPLVDCTVVGVTRPQELEWDLAALDTHVSRADLESIAAAGPVDPWVLGGPDFIWPFPLERTPEALKGKI